MIRAAYIGYMSDQNEPSKPELVELDDEFLNSQLLQLWAGLSGDEDGNPVPPFGARLEEGSRWGDICVTNGDVALFVTFHDVDRMTALQKLRMA